MAGRHRLGRPAPAHWVALGVGVLLAGCAGGTPGSGEPAGHGASTTASITVECGLSTFDDGHQVMRYCGEGEARITTTAGPTEVTGAECRRRGEFVTANFGTNFSNEKAAQGQYLGLLLGAVPGETSSGKGPAKASGKAVQLSGLEVVIDGKRQPLSDATATAALNDGRLEGTVTGRTDAGAATIEFHCTTS